MISTIPNVKRAELSSNSPKLTSQTISHGSSIVVNDSSKTLNTNIEGESSSYADGIKDDVIEDRIPIEEQIISITNPVTRNVNGRSRIEEYSNKKSIESTKKTSNDRTSFNTTNISSNLPDMSRRKQRNPKPTLFTSLEGNEYEKKAHNMQIVKQNDDEMCASDNSDADALNDKQKSDHKGIARNNVANMCTTTESTEDAHSTCSSSHSSSSPTSPPHDLSSLVKVEVHEGTTDVGLGTPRSPRILSTMEHAKDINEEAKHQNLLKHCSSSRPSTSSLPTLTQRPSQQQMPSLLMPHPPIIMPAGMVPELGAEEYLPFAAPMHLSKMMMSHAAADMTRNIGLSKTETDLAPKQNNMFHFGDVSVAHHPDTSPVPMVIPMVYLYPLPPTIDKTGKT